MHSSLHTWKEGRKEGRTDGRTDGRKEARKEGRKDGRTDGRMDGWMHDRRRSYVSIHRLPRETIDPQDCYRCCSGRTGLDFVGRCDCIEIQKQPDGECERGIEMVRVRAERHDKHTSR